MARTRPVRIGCWTCDTGERDETDLAVEQDFKALDDLVLKIDVDCFPERDREERRRS